MVLKVRQAFYEQDSSINTPRIVGTSQLLQRLVGMPVQRNKAIVGANAFAHESGIHQHGMLRHRGTYEIMRPEDVGWEDSQMVLVATVAAPLLKRACVRWASGWTKTN